jgi:DNA processing protein
MSGGRNRFWDERSARAAWSRLTEPGDAAAGHYVAELGAGPALGALLGGHAPAAQAARWQARLGALDVRRDLAELERLGGRLIVPADPEWPASLDDLGDRRPFCLWARGPHPLAGPGAPERSVAVVGARASTRYGEQVAASLAAGVADQGVVVISGAAYGIDAAAHRGALAVDGPTVAILAGGLDRPYPRGNTRLIERIAADGCVVSEVPPGTGPTRWRFLQRNRLIAAHAGASVVVEAALRSGAATTAREAVGLGRPVAAVPGPVTSPASAGCHALLREGVTCVTGADEVLELLAPVGEDLAPRRRGHEADHDGLDPDQIRVLDALPLRGTCNEPALCREAGLDPATVRACLGILELRQLARRRDDGWRRAAPRPGPGNGPRARR